MITVSPRGRALQQASLAGRYTEFEAGKGLEQVISRGSWTRRRQRHFGACRARKAPRSARGVRAKAQPIDQLVGLSTPACRRRCPTGQRRTRGYSTGQLALDHGARRRPRIRRLAPTGIGEKRRHPGPKKTAPASAEQAHDHAKGGVAGAVRRRGPRRRKTRRDEP